MVLTIFGYFEIDLAKDGSVIADRGIDRIKASDVHTLEA